MRHTIEKVNQTITSGIISIPSIAHYSDLMHRHPYLTQILYSSTDHYCNRALAHLRRRGIFPQFCAVIENYTTSYNETIVRHIYRE